MLRVGSSTYALSASCQKKTRKNGYRVTAKGLRIVEQGVSGRPASPSRCRSRSDRAAKAEGRFGKQDFVYLADENVYRCPAGEKLKYRYTTEENGQTLHRYWADACRTCAIKDQCTTGKERRITRWEHEEIVEAAQERLDKNRTPCARGARRSSIRSGQ